MTPPLEQLIRTVRNKRVLLDADLAAIYAVPTKALNQAIRRNPERFPEDFAFQLTKDEFDFLRSQIVTLKKPGPGQHRKYLPFAFTEYGALMAANLLRSPEAIQMSIYVVRAFGKQRELLMGQAEILKRLAEIDTQLLGHDKALHAIWREIQSLLQPPPAPKKTEIGFHVREDSPEYRVSPRRTKKP
jgi:hypothetical protein